MKYIVSFIISFSVLVFCAGTTIATPFTLLMPWLRAISLLGTDGILEQLYGTG